MADADYFTDLTNLRSIIAFGIVTNVNSPGNLTVVSEYLTADYLAHQTVEITYNGYYNAPDTITLTLVDPAWVIQTSGLCDLDADGLLPIADFNFPVGTDVWWRLDQVNNQTGDPSQAGLQLVFQHRVGSYLQEDWGPLKVAAGTTTRAQFVKQLCDRIPKALSGRTPGLLGEGTPRSQQIQFVCPELNVVQPLEGANSNIVTSDSTTVRNSQAQVNKTKAIGYGVTDLTVKGVKMTRAQINVANTLLQEADSLNAQDVVLQALMVAAIYENSMSLGQEANGRIGPLSPFPTSYYTDNLAGAANQAHDFCVGGGGNAFSAAIAYAKANSSVDPVTQAEYAEGAEGQYQAEAFPQAQAVAEASKIVAAYGGSSGGSPGSSVSTSTTSDVGELARGTTDSPDEDSLTCIQRLAAQVNWEFYICAHPAEGQWGNYAYYRTGPNNAVQMPTAYLTRSGTNAGTWDLTSATATSPGKVTNCLIQQPTYTVDNSAFSYQTTKYRHGKVQRKVSTVQPQSPTQVQIQLICTPMTYAAGDVFVFADSGPLNGRWIISQIERNLIGDTFDQITLVPPTIPDPEPSITVSTTSNTKTGSLSTNAGLGTLAKAVELATAAAALEAEKHCYTYTEDTTPEGSGEVRTNAGHSPLKPPYTFDCSGFCGSVYDYAGLDCPYGSAGYGGTSGDVPMGCTQVSQGDAVPGDLCLFPGHVCIWIGNGQVVNMGAQGEPYVTALQNEIDAHAAFLGFYHLIGAS